MACRTICLAALLISAACGGSQQTSTPPSAAPTTFTLSGFVRDVSSGRNMTGATVAVTSGANANHSATTDGNGYYAMPSLAPATFTVHISANGFDATDSSVTLSQNSEVDFTLKPTAPAASCDASLWPHVHDPKRLTVKSSCITVTGTLMESHSNDDGDIDMDVDVDPQYKYLLNNGNLSSLMGYLHVEAICQSKVHDDVPNAKVSCGTFTGHIPIPANGSYVAVTGVYLLDGDHGWMEIHPISAMTVLR